LALEHHFSSNTLRESSWSNLFSLQRPVSITTVISGIVIEVSAMLVATTILILFGYNEKTLLCSELGRVECKGNIMVSSSCWQFLSESTMSLIASIPNYIIIVLVLVLVMVIVLYYN
jgi:hypothetical protein